MASERSPRPFTSLEAWPVGVDMASRDVQEEPGYLQEMTLVVLGVVKRDKEKRETSSQIRQKDRFSTVTSNLRWKKTLS
jgi:hypothetical protein